MVYTFESKVSIIFKSYVFAFFQKKKGVEKIIVELLYSFFE